MYQAGQCLLEEIGESRSDGEPILQYYNFGRVLQTLQVTPAMEAGLADHVWAIEEIVGLLDRQR